MIIALVQPVQESLCLIVAKPAKIMRVQLHISPKNRTCPRNLTL
jgi:hypothetical protein